MAEDSGERRLDPEAAVAPNRDRRGEPPIIEGEVTARHDAPAAASEASPKMEAPAAGASQGPPAQKAEKKPAAEEPAAEKPPAEESPVEEPPGAKPEQEKPGAFAAPTPVKSGRARAFIAACLGGLVGAVVAGGIVGFERSTVDSGFSERLAALEAPINDLTRRVGALEAAASSGKAAADAAKTIPGDIQAARADAAKALALATKTAAAIEQRKDVAPAQTGPAIDVGAIEARLRKLESASTAASGSAASLAPLEERLAKIEATLAAPKNESRLAPEASAPRRSDGAALAVAAEAVSGRLAAGAPYSAEQGALERLGADPAKTAALKPFAESGAPTGAALAAGFAKIAPDALKAAAPTGGGGVMDRLMSNMSKIVKITPVGATAGDDPAALISQVEAALDRGEIDGAMALWARLPEPMRRASRDWASGAQARLAADAAAQSILSDAMTKLASGDKQ
jgi:hypothetical protein